MAFKSDKQRKAVMAQLNQPTRSDTSPVVVQSKFQKLKGFIAKEKELIRQKKESKGLARIERGKIALSKEKATANRLRAELEVEQARESVASQRRETQAEFSKIEQARLSRTTKGRAILFARGLPALAGRGLRRGVFTGIKKLRQPAPRTRSSGRKKKRKSETETLPFGIG